MTINPPRLLRPPEILNRGNGLALLHWGVTDGPHGVSLVVEVVDEEGTGRLQRDVFQASGTVAFPLVATAVVPGHDLATPKVMTRDAGPSYQRFLVTFDRYRYRHGAAPRQPGLDTALIALAVVPVGLSGTIDLSTQTRDISEH